jgi:Methyltransferase domain
MSQSSLAQLTDLRDRYLDGSYLNSNPDWHTADSAWKAAHVERMIGAHRLAIGTVCEVGCGAGEILRQLWRCHHDHASFVGYEISPDAYALAQTRSAQGLEFRLEAPTARGEHYDLMLLMDVVEHVPDCAGFLQSLCPIADRVIMHIPLELSIQALLRRGRLQRSREILGHLHFFTADLALALVRDAHFEILDVVYTSSGIDRPPQSVLASVARHPRRLLGRLNEPLAARVLGGFALLVLAAPRDYPS